jgi:hypothetical protein
VKQKESNFIINCEICVTRAVILKSSEHVYNLYNFNHGLHIIIYYMQSLQNHM